MKTKRLLSLALALLLVLTWVPITAGAEIVSDESAILYFTTFEDLKTLAVNSYEQDTFCRYIGDGALVIQEDLAIPSNLVVAAETLVIPNGVTLTITDSSCMVYVDNLTVEGTIVNNGYLFLGNYADPGTISVSGTIQNNGDIHVWGGYRNIEVSG